MSEQPKHLALIEKAGLYLAFAVLAPLTTFVIFVLLDIIFYSDKYYVLPPLWLTELIVEAVVVILVSLPCLVKAISLFIKASRAGATNPKNKV